MDESMTREDLMCEFCAYRGDETHKKGWYECEVNFCDDGTPIWVRLTDGCCFGELP